MEDEVQYLGTFPRTSPPLLMARAERPITGVWLIHMPDDDEEKPLQSNFYFYKKHSSVVQIGRAPSSATAVVAAPNRAAFRCPVMSRNHAKIIFAEPGRVHLIDLGSHHGTYVLKQGVPTSMRLIPEFPVSLSHGDTIIFGKSVGRAPSIVRPVVVVVRLLHDSVPPPPAPVRTFASLCRKPESETTPKPSSSGRYGIYDVQPDSASSQSAGSSSDESTSGHGSDVEEIDVEEVDPPEEYPIERSEVSPGSDNPYAPSIRGFGLLHRILPMMHAPQPISPTPSSPLLSRQGSKHIWFYDDDVASNASTGQASSNAVPVEQQDENVANIVDIAEASSPQESSGSNVDAPHSDPPLIGAYPLSRVTSPTPPDLLPAVDASAVLETVTSDAGQVSPAAYLDSDMDESSSVDGDAPQNVQESFAISEPQTIIVQGEGEEQPMVVEVAPGVGDVPHVSPRSPSLDSSPMCTTPSPVDVKMTSLEDSLVNLRASVLRVNIAHRKTQSDQKAQSDRAAALDKRIDETNAQYETLCDRIDGAYDSCNDLRGELSNLGDGLKSFEERLNQSVTDAALKQVEQVLAQRPPAPTFEMLENALIDRDDVKSSIQTLRNLVAELQALKESTSEELADELERLRAARAEAIQTAALSSLKRKRSDVDETDDSTYHAGVVRDGLPQAKRSRKVIRAAVHTAAAVSVGAVAAWSALAFT